MPQPASSDVLTVDKRYLLVVRCHLPIMAIVLNLPMGNTHMFLSKNYNFIINGG